MEIKVNMVLERTTPGTGLFREVDSNGQTTPPEFQKIGNLYIKKRAFNGSGVPQKITVTVVIP